MNRLFASPTKRKRQRKHPYQQQQQQEQQQQEGGRKNQKAQHEQQETALKTHQQEQYYYYNPRKNHQDQNDQTTETNDVIKEGNEPAVTLPSPVSTSFTTPKKYQGSTSTVLRQQVNKQEHSLQSNIETNMDHNAATPLSSSSKQRRPMVPMMTNTLGVVTSVHAKQYQDEEEGDYYHHTQQQQQYSPVPINYSYSSSSTPNSSPSRKPISNHTTTETSTATKAKVYENNNNHGTISISTPRIQNVKVQQKQTELPSMNGNNSENYGKSSSSSLSSIHTPKMEQQQQEKHPKDIESSPLLFATPTRTVTTASSSTTTMASTNITDALQMSHSPYSKNLSSSSSSLRKEEKFIMQSQEILKEESEDDKAPDTIADTSTTTATIKKPLGQSPRPDSLPPAAPAVVVGVSPLIAAKIAKFSQQQNNTSNNPSYLYSKQNPSTVSNNPHFRFHKKHTIGMSSNDGNTNNYNGINDDNNKLTDQGDDKRISSKSHGTINKENGQEYENNNENSVRNICPAWNGVEETTARDGNRIGKNSTRQQETSETILHAIGNDGKINKEKEEVGYDQDVENENHESNVFQAFDEDKEEEQEDQTRDIFQVLEEDETGDQARDVFQVLDEDDDDDDAGDIFQALVEDDRHQQLQIFNELARYDNGHDDDNDSNRTHDKNFTSHPNDTPSFIFSEKLPEIPRSFSALTMDSELVLVDENPALAEINASFLSAEQEEASQQESDFGQQETQQSSAFLSLMDETARSQQNKWKREQQLEGWTINKLRFQNLGIYGRRPEINLLQKRLDSMILQSSSSNNKSNDALNTSHSSGSFIFEDPTTTNNKNELILISGSSGTGKTTLAETLKTKVVKKNEGLFVKGKFELELRNQQPYLAIIQICREISAHISSLRSSSSSASMVYKDICEAIRKSMENTDRKFCFSTLSEFIPDLEMFFLEDQEKTFKNDNYQEQQGQKTVKKEEKETSLSVGGSSVEEFKADHKNRLYNAIQSFLGIVASFCVPLVVVLDDLQWADSGSLEILERLMMTSNQEQQSPIMIIGCYRSNEIDNQHIFSSILKDMRAAAAAPPAETSIVSSDNSNSQDHDKDNDNNNKGSFNITEISLGNLKVPNVNRILMDLLNIDDPSKTLGLAQICHRRTDGNPFFFISFVTMLCEEGLLEYNFGLLEWVWSDSIIEEKTMATTNVVDMIRTKMLNQLEGDVSELLKLAAFLGTTFKEELVNILWNEIFQGEPLPESSPLETNETTMTTTRRSAHVILTDAIDQSFLEQVGESSCEKSRGYRWVHDKVQEAAISLIHPDEIRDLKYKAGRILLDKLVDGALQESIFVVCNLLNVSVGPGGVLRVEEERSLRIRMAELNLQAARKAVKSSSFDIAEEYASKGIVMLPKQDCWIVNKRLSLELYSIAVVVENILGRVEDMRVHSSIVLGQKNCTLEEQLRVYHVLIDSMAERGGLEAGKQLCFEVLGRLGFHFPTNTTRRLFSIIRGARRAQKASKHLNVDEILRLGCTGAVMSYENVQKMKLLDKAASLCYKSGSPLLPLIILRMLKMATKNGLSQYSPIAYVLTAMLMVMGLSDYHAAARYADVAMEIISRMKFQNCEARCTMLVHFMIFPWSRPFISLLKPLVRCYEVGLQTGDTESALIAIHCYCAFRFATGKSLERVAEDYSVFIKQAKDLKKPAVVSYMVPFHQMILNLMARDSKNNNTIIMTGEVMNEEEYLSNDDIPPMGRAFLKFCKLVACVYFGDYQAGISLAKKSLDDNLTKVTPGFGMTILDSFYRAFLFVAVAKKEKRNRGMYQKEAKKQLKSLETQIQKGNPNVVHLLALLKAELYALEGNTKLAKHHYEAAIHYTAKCGILHEAAMAQERLGDMLYGLLKNNKNKKGNIEDEAKYHWAEAIRLYSEWGCIPKVNSVQNKVNKKLRSALPNNNHNNE